LAIADCNADVSVVRQRLAAPAVAAAAAAAALDAAVRTKRVFSSKEDLRARREWNSGIAAAAVAVAASGRAPPELDDGRLSRGVPMTILQ
jgi:hypothetical protein